MFLIRIRHRAQELRVAGQCGGDQRPAPSGEKRPPFRASFRSEGTRDGRGLPPQCALPFGALPLSDEFKIESKYSVLPKPEAITPAGDRR